MKRLSLVRFQSLVRELFWISWARLYIVLFSHSRRISTYKIVHFYYVIMLSHIMIKCLPYLPFIREVRGSYLDLEVQELRLNFLHWVKSNVLEVKTPCQWAETGTIIIIIIIIKVCHHGLFRFRSNDFWNLRIYFLTFGRTPWTGDRPVARPLPTQDSTIQRNADTYPCLKRDSNPRSQCSSGRKQYVPLGPAETEIVY
jgi:hypothetical protein